MTEDVGMMVVGCGSLHTVHDELLEAGHVTAEALEARGHAVRRPGPVRVGIFGGGQAIERLPGGVLAGASDRRKDGCARGVG